MSAGSELFAALERTASDSAPLAVDANLGVTVGGTKLAVSTSGDRLRVQVPSVGAAASLLRTEGDRIRELSGLLAAAGVTTEIRVGDAVVAVVGAEAAPGSVRASLWGEGVEIRPEEVLAAALRLK